MAKKKPLTWRPLDLKFVDARHRKLRKALGSWGGTAILLYTENMLYSNGGSCKKDDLIEELCHEFEMTQTKIKKILDTIVTLKILESDQDMISSTSLSEEYKTDMKSYQQKIDASKKASETRTRPASDSDETPVTPESSDDQIFNY